MRLHTLLQDADGLIVRRGRFFKKHHELKMDTEIETLLRASIAGATNGTNKHLLVSAWQREEVASGAQVSRRNRKVLPRPYGIASIGASGTRSRISAGSSAKSSSYRSADYVS